MVVEREAEKVRSELTGMIQRVQTQLVAQGVVGLTGQLRMRLEQVREEAHALEESLAGIIGGISGDIIGGESGRKRPFGRGGATGGVRQTNRMADLLEQMRAV